MFYIVFNTFHNFSVWQLFPLAPSFVHFRLALYLSLSIFLSLSSFSLFLSLCPVISFSLFFFHSHSFFFVFIRCPTTKIKSMEGIFANSFLNKNFKSYVMIKWCIKCMSLVYIKKCKLDLFWPLRYPITSLNLMFNIFW